MITYLHVDQKAVQNISILKQSKEYFFSCNTHTANKIPSVQLMSNLKENILYVKTK
jgi:hypothetical protein